MNSRQLYYVIKLSKSLNFSLVAEQLNITQPALSKQIISLEKELGIKLFDRSSSSLKLTPAGEHFVREAEELLYKEDQLLRSMEQFKSGKEGRLTIGISPFRSLYFIPPIIQSLKEKYPGIQIFLNETNSDTLRKEVVEGKYDFAIVNLPVDESLLDVIELESDQLVLAVPNSLLDTIGRTPTKELCEISFKDCEKLPFVVVGQTQEMRQLFNKLCARASIHPIISMEVVGVTTAWAMTNAGVGATLLPLQFIKNDSFDKNVTLFSLKDNVYTRKPVIVTRRGQFISEYAQEAIELLKKYK